MALAAALSTGFVPATGCVDRAPALGSGGGSSGGSTSATGTTGTGGATATGTGTGTGASSSSTGPETTTGCPYIDCLPDFVGPSLWCNLWLQDCPSGDKCVPWANDAGDVLNDTKCTSLDPAPVEVGEPCTVQGYPTSGRDNCEKGAICWNVDPNTLTGVCVALCAGSPDMPVCPAGGLSCTPQYDGFVHICLSGCDPLLQDCDPGFECLPTADGLYFVCVEDGGNAPAGDPCDFAEACAAGSVCAAADLVPGCTSNTGCCAPFCDLQDPGADAACAAAYPTPGASCVPFSATDPPFPGTENVGVCRLPQ